MKKVIIIIITAAVSIALIVGGIFIYRTHKRNSNPAKVYSVSNFLDFFGYSSESMDGSVTYEDEQTVIVGAGQTIEEVYVKKGQKVKTGDPILKYDMTLYQLKINTVRANISLNNARLEAANRKLTKLKNTTPVEKNDEPDNPDETDTGEPTTEPETEHKPVKPDATPGDPEYGVIGIFNKDGTPYKEPGQDDENADNGEGENGDAGDGNTGDGENGDGNFEQSYTKEELAAAIRETQDTIRDLKLSNQRNQLQIKKYQNTIENGTVIAKMDGVIEELDVSEEQIGKGEPVVRLKGEGQSIVSVNVSEWMIDKVHVGDELSVLCYDNGESYAGKITEISLTPLAEEGMSYGSATASQYPVTITITDENEMDQYSWVQVNLEEKGDSDEPEMVISLPLFMLKDENGNYYVMKEVDGELKKQYVKTGKIYWGQYMSIKEGLTEEDWIAFPYSKDANEGRTTVHSENLEELER